MLHKKGHVTFRQPEDVDLRRQLVRYERLVSRARAVGTFCRILRQPLQTRYWAVKTYTASSLSFWISKPRVPGLAEDGVSGNEMAGHVVRIKVRKATTSVKPCSDSHLADALSPAW